MVLRMTHRNSVTWFGRDQDFVDDMDHTIGNRDVGNDNSARDFGAVNQIHMTFEGRKNWESSIQMLF